MKHRPFRPPQQRHAITHREGGLYGPLFLMPRTSCWQEWKPEGPREMVEGRWFSAVRASHRRYVSRAPLRSCPRADLRQRKRWAISEFLGGDRACPF